MPNKSTRQIHLIDLVMAVLFCGLIVAMFTPVAGFEDPNLTFLGAIIIGVVWYTLRFRRAAPSAECAHGSSRRGADTRLYCPHCGELQSRVRWALLGRSFVRYLIAVGTGIFIVALSTFSRDPLSVVYPFEGTRLVALLMAAASAVVCGLLIAWLVATRPGKARPKAERTCKACGKPIRTVSQPPTVCPNCRRAKIGHAVLKKQRARYVRNATLWLGIAAIAGTVGLTRALQLTTRTGNWTWLGVFLVLAVVGMFFVWKWSVFLIRSRRLSGVLGEEAALAKAACSGEENRRQGRRDHDLVFRSY